MALRGYTCKCGRVTDELFDGEYPKSIQCECGRMAEYKIGGIGFSVDFRDGFDAGAGQHFGTARQRDTFLDKNNLGKAPDGAYEAPYKG